MLRLVALTVLIVAAGAANLRATEEAQRQSSKVLTQTAQKLADAMLATPCVVSEANLLETLKKVEDKAKADLDEVSSKGETTAAEIRKKLNVTLEAAITKFNQMTTAEGSKRDTTVRQCTGPLGKLKSAQKAKAAAFKAANGLAIQAATNHRENKDASDQANARHLAALKAKEEALEFRSNATARGTSEARAAWKADEARLKKEHEQKMKLAAESKNGAMGECQKLYDQSVKFVNQEKSTIRKIQEQYKKLDACLDKSLKAHPPKNKMEVPTNLLEVSSVPACKAVRDEWRRIAPELAKLSAKTRAGMPQTFDSFVELRARGVPLQGQFVTAENLLVEEQQMLDDCQERVKGTHAEEKMQLDAAKKASLVDIQATFDDIALDLETQTNATLARVNGDVMTAKLEAEEAAAKKAKSLKDKNSKKGASDKLSGELEALNTEVTSKATECDDVKSEAFLRYENAVGRYRANKEQASTTAQEFASESLTENERGVAEKKKLLNIQLDLVQSVRREASKLRLMRLQKRVLPEQDVETDDHQATLMKRKINTGTVSLFGTIQMADAAGDEKDAATQESAEAILAKAVSDLVKIDLKRVIVTYKGDGKYGFVIPALTAKQAYDRGDVMQQTMRSTYNQAVVLAAKSLNMESKGLVLSQILVNVEADKGVHTKGTIDFNKFFDEGEVKAELPNVPTGPEPTTTTTTEAPQATGPTGATGTTGAPETTPAPTTTTTPKPVNPCFLPSYSGLLQKLEMLRTNANNKRPEASKTLKGDLKPEGCKLTEAARLSVTVLTVKDVLINCQKTNLQQLDVSQDAVTNDQWKSLTANGVCRMETQADTMSTFGKPEWDKFKVTHDKLAQAPIMVTWTDLRDCMGADNTVKAIKARDIVVGDTAEDTKSCMPKKELATMLKCKGSVLDEACLSEGGKDKMVTEEMFQSSVGSKAVVPTNVDADKDAAEAANKSL